MLSRVTPTERTHDGARRRSSRPPGTAGGVPAAAGLVDQRTPQKSEGRQRGRAGPSRSALRSCPGGGGRMLQARRRNVLSEQAAQPRADDQRPVRTVEMERGAGSRGQATSRRDVISNQQL